MKKLRELWRAWVKRAVVKIDKNYKTQESSE